MSLDGLRARIDALDREIVRLLNERAALAADIGRIKQEANDPVHAPAREKQVLSRVTGANEGPLSDAALSAIYGEIISACRALQRRPRVAFLGPRGTFSHQGVKARFGSDVDLVEGRTIRSVFSAVARGEADFGVVPIENSTEGGIGETMDALIDTPLQVCGEISIPVHHNLMGRGRLEDVERVCSKLQVFEQCSAWLAANLPNADLVEVASTTQAAERASRDAAVGAICHEEAARLYGLEILAPRIEDDPRNATRFLVVGNEPAAPTGADRTSLICFIKDEVGALLRILERFRDHGLNLTFIESRPSRRRMWDYCFFIDFEGHIADRHVAEAIEEVRRVCGEVKLLGSYPISR